MALREWTPSDALQEETQFVVKLGDDVDLGGGLRMADLDRARGVLGLGCLPTQVSALFHSVSEADIQALLHDARRTDENYKPPRFENFLAVSTPQETAPLVAEVLAKESSKVESVQSGVEAFYLAEPKVPATENASIGEREATVRQPHLGAAGVNALAVREVAGGDGGVAGLRFIDVEMGWDLSHPDLAGMPIAYCSGVNHKDKQHGAAVLGIVAGRGAVGVGCAGVAPAIPWIGLASVWRVDPALGKVAWNPADALMAAVCQRAPGHVLVVLLETMTAEMWPIEIQLAVFQTIAAAARAGVTIVEAAGNRGSNFIDLHRPGNHVNPRAHDSLATMVGAGQRDLVQRSWKRHPFSNYDDRRIDCFGWGDGVVTAGYYPFGEPQGQGVQYTEFGRTSAAAAMVAGTAVSLQGMCLARRGRPALPLTVRALLRHSNTGVAADLVGVMPDLGKIERRIST